MSPAVDRLERRVFVAALCAWIAIVLIGWLLGGPLGHDEAAYAIGADATLHGRGPPWLYRSVGMHALAAFGVLAGGSEAALRVPAVAFAIGFPFALRRCGRALGLGAGAWAVAVVVGMHGLTLRGHELLSDLPSTTCLLAGLAVLVEQFELDGGPTWRLVIAAPWLAAGFYLRYASCVVIALVGVVALAVWWRQVVARPRPVVATIGALALLLAPHAVHALATTGSPLGIIRFSSGVPRRTYHGEGLVTYLTGDPFVQYGVLAAPVLIAGALAIVRRPAAARRPALVMWLVAVGQIAVLGWLSHAMARYIFVALALLVVLGVDAIARAWTWAAARAAPIARARTAAWATAIGLCALAWLGVAAATVWMGENPDDWRRPVVEAAAAIRRDAHGRDCHIVSRRFAQVMWYSGCRAGDQTAPGAKLERGVVVYRVWIARSPGTPELEGFGDTASVPLDFVEIAARPGLYTVTRVTRHAP